MVAWRCEISLLTRSLRSLSKHFSTIEEEFRISTQLCDIFFIFNFLPDARSL